MDSLKKKKIPMKYYYFLFFFCNFFNSFALLRGWFNPNISATSDILGILLGSIGDIGVLCFIYIIVQILFKTDKRKVLVLNLVSCILTLLIVFLQCFATLFSTFFSYTQLTSFKNPAQGALIGTYITYFLTVFTQAYVILPVSVLVVFLVFSYFINKRENIKYKFKPKLMFLILSILIMMFPVTANAIRIKGSANELSMNAIYGTSNVGTYNYYIYSVSDLWKKEVKVTEDKEEAMNVYLNNNKYSLSESNSYASIASGKNLIMIQMEAINNFVIGLEIDGELIAPNLTKLASEGYYNSRFYSTAGMGNTSDCEFSTNIGMYPNGNDLSIFELDGKNYPTLAKEFKKIGYDTLSIHGNDGRFYNRNYQHVNLFGFDEHIDKIDLLNRNSKLEILKGWISDEALLDESINIYNEFENNFFSYNILVSSHAPFGIDGKIEKYNNSKLTALANDYVANVKYVDKCIGDYIQKLKNNGLYDDSIIIIYGDHTSTLLKPDTESLTHLDYKDIEFRMEMQNVPFIILGDKIPNIKDNSVHSNVDIFPTIAALFGFKPEYNFGVDMFSNESSFAYSPRSLDLIFDDYTIITASKTVHYISNDINKISKKEMNKIIDWFLEYKYCNDLIVATNYFK